MFVERTKKGSFKHGVECKDIRGNKRSVELAVDDGKNGGKRIARPLWHHLSGKPRIGRKTRINETASATRTSIYPAETDLAAPAPPPPPVDKGLPPS